MADDYGDDLDALTSLLDEDDDENPYDNAEPFSVKSEETECTKVARAVKKMAPEKDKRTGSESSQDEEDHGKSKQELIEELQRMRALMSSQVQEGASSASQSSAKTKTPPKESFSSALFPDSQPTAGQIMKKEGKKSPPIKTAESEDDDFLSDLFDDETEEKPKKDGTRLTPQKAENLFKKSKGRVAHTPQSSAPPKKASPYRCKECDKTFDNLKLMKIHEFKHKAKAHSCACNICGKSFTDELQLKTHERTHKTSKSSNTKKVELSASPNLAIKREKQSGIGSNGGGGGGGGGSGLFDSGSRKSSVNSVPQIGSGAKRKPAPMEEVCETEYFSRIRIINPLVSSAVLKERMQGRKMIRMSILKHYSRTGDMEGDWVTMGVIVRKMQKTDCKGKPYSLWILNDLSQTDQCVALFLFGKVYEEHWKTSEGSVIGILNASLMDRKDQGNSKNSDDVQIRVDHPQKLLLLGKSKDFGRCKGTTKSGQPCSQFINTSESQYCSYHVQSEFKKAGAKRSELSSSYSGVTPKSYAKKLQKGNFIYGGQTVVPSMGMSGGGVKSQSKMTNNYGPSGSGRLSLKGLGVKGADALVEEAKKSVLTLHGKTDREKDMLVQVKGATKEFSNLLKAPSAGTQNIMRHMVTVEKNKKVVNVVSANNLLKQHKQDMASKKAARASLSSPSPTPRQRTLLDSTRHNSTPPPPPSPADTTPKLGRGWSGGGDIDLDIGASPVRFGGGPSAKKDKGKTSTALAKQKALDLIRRKGPLKKDDPNAVKTTLNDRKKEAMKRRVEENWKRDELEEEDPDSPSESRPAKKRKTFLGQDLDMSQDELDKIVKAKSSHAGLLAEHEAELMEQYFKEMDKKEGLENKMDSIRELKCKVVSCKECCFTWFKPSSLCNQENHTLRWHEAKQRFFRCRDCNSRAIAFDRLPNKACRCGGTRFERTSMLKERDGPKIGSETLKIRGDEERWL